MTGRVSSYLRCQRPEPTDRAVGENIMRTRGAGSSRIARCQAGGSVPFAALWRCFGLAGATAGQRHDAAARGGPNAALEGCAAERPPAIDGRQQIVGEALGEGGPEQVAVDAQSLGCR